MLFSKVLFLLAGISTLTGFLSCRNIAGVPFGALF